MNSHTSSLTRSLRVPLTAALATVAVMLTACSSHEPVETDFEAEFAAGLEAAIEEARENNAAATQVLALEAARETGEVSIDVAREAAHETATCLTDLGWNASYEETTAADGMVLPSVSVTVPNDEPDRDPTAALDECERQHFYWLNQMYSTQPLARELAYAHIRERAHVVRPCLAENGFPVEVDASVDELISAHWDLLRETETRDGGPVDCMHEAGIGSF